MKKIIPNILTFSRILVTPLIIYLGINNQLFYLIIIAIFIAFTDFLDGRLARRWNITSQFGARLDTIGDKCLAFSLLIILISHNQSFIYIFILEFLISIFNLYVLYKIKTAESLLIGKIKTWIIFITIILGFINIAFPPMQIPINIFVILTVILQIGSLLQYIDYYYTHKTKKNNPLLDKEYYKLTKTILENKEFLKRKNYAHHYNESVYDHVLRVSYDCYQIGKKLKLDYQSLAIAGLLHDFYDKPWQSNLKKVPFFKQHGFIHAEQAKINAQKIFPELVDNKIASMIKTHMFPLNKTIPQYRESWLLTFIDKIDSLEFLFHPWLLFRSCRKKSLNKPKNK